MAQQARLWYLALQTKGELPAKRNPVDPRLTGPQALQHPDFSFLVIKDSVEKGNNSSQYLRNLLDLGLAISLLELGKVILLSDVSTASMKAA